ncbi:aminotransferase class IV [Methylobacterium platani]|uniref:Probable branched-chain-amino-acid aminotransferase n=2 Tax=Methylobacterium platani TaxID=427683 RepID=A0A179SAB8_9HYPH|nr:aminotransferase class IV [Methylobacterium platani]KMO11094.1 class IV aminotransferase [Methylobacterium platani JCM 14648]OAS23775.1 class IV aminotransferase [Methylobacterium platani]
MLWRDGRLQEDTVAPFDLADRGLLLGDGVFDTAMALGGTVVAEAAHLARLAASAAALGFAFDEAEARAGIRALAAALPRAAIRTTVTRGPGPRGLRPPAEPRPVLWASAAPLRPGTAFAELSLGWSAIRRNETSPAARHKTLGYLDAVMAAEAAAGQGHDEAIFLTMQGRVACAGTGNLFAVSGRTIVTPPLEDGVLAGIVRARVLALAPRLGLAPAERPLTPDALAGAEAVFLTNSLRLVAPVRRIGERDYASAGHPVVSALRSALSREIAEACGMAVEG